MAIRVTTFVLAVLVSAVPVAAQQPSMSPAQIAQVRIQNDEFEVGRLSKGNALLAMTGKTQTLIQKGPLDPGHPIVVSSDDENAHRLQREWQREDFHEPRAGVNCARG